MHNTVLILGARGRFGLATARAFANAGWHVLGHIRPGAQVPDNAGSIEWLDIDLQDTDTLVQAAQGATVVVHALNPAYTNAAWKAQALPMTEAALAIARALGATLMVPGNVYNFGVNMPPVLREHTPQQARTVKGQVRVQMEALLESSGVPCVVIRAGDFFGAGTGTWFDKTVVKDIRKGVFTYPGAPDVSTAWAYLPDLGRAFVEVALRRASLQRFEVFHFAGHSVTGQRWMDVLTPVARAQGWMQPSAALKLARLPWAVIRMGALFIPTWAALREMQYLWTTPHALANEKLTALIGPEPHTPLAHAAQQAVADLGFIVPKATTSADSAGAQALAVQ